MSVPKAQKPHLLVMLGPTFTGFNFENWINNLEIPTTPMYQKALLAHPGTPQTQQHHWLIFVTKNKNVGMTIWRDTYTAFYRSALDFTDQNIAYRIGTSLTHINRYDLETLKQKLVTIDLDALTAELALSITPDDALKSAATVKKESSAQVAATFWRYLKTAPAETPTNVG